MKPEAFSSDGTVTSETLPPARALIVAPDTAISFDNRHFYGIKALGFTEDQYFIVDLYTTPGPKPRGGYFTTIPISPLRYRAQHGTRCSFRDEGEQLIVFDDWGTKRCFRGSRSVLGPLADQIRANEIPEENIAQRGLASEPRAKR